MKKIIFMGLEYSKANIMGKGYKYFSKQVFYCYDCREQIIVAAYSVNKSGGYFKTLKNKNHLVNCGWEKTKKYIPQYGNKALLKRLISRLKNKGKSTAKAPLTINKNNKVSKSSSLKVEKILHNKKINIGTKSAFIYNGKINNIDIWDELTFISLFRDKINDNVRIAVKLFDNDVSFTGKTVYLAISNGVVRNSSSRFNSGIDIPTTNDHIMIEKS